MSRAPNGSEQTNRWLEYVLQQDPVTAAPKAPRIPNTTWEFYRTQIESLYPRYTLNQIMEFMAVECGFAPSQHQYTLRFSQWGLAKNKGKLRHLQPDPVISPPAMGTSGDQHPRICRTPSMNHNGDPMDIDTHVKSDSEAHDPSPSSPNLVPEGRFKPSLSAAIANDPDSLRRRGMSWIYDDSDPAVELLSPSTNHINRGSLLPDISMRDVVGYLEVPDARSSTREGSPKSMFDSADKASSVLPSTGEFRGDMEQVASTLWPSYIGTPSPMSALRYIFVDPEDRSTQKVSISAFVVSVESQAPRNWMTTHDLDQVQTLVDVFRSAHCYEDAFRVSQMILRQCWRQTPGSATLIRPATELASSGTNEIRGFSFKKPFEWQLLLISVLKNCTTVYDCTEYEAMLKDVWKLMPHLQQCRSEVDCLQRSYLGDMHRLLGSIRLARKETESAWDAYCSLANAGLPTGTREILHQNMISASLDNPFNGVSPMPLIPFDDQTDEAVRKALSNAFSWCRRVLFEENCVSFFDEADEALWTGPARRTDLFRTEEVVLFCYLWTIWRRHASPFNPWLADEASSQRSADCHSFFVVLETYCHVSVFDALSTLARMIVHQLWLDEGTLGHGDDMNWHYDDSIVIVLTAEEVRRHKSTLAQRLILGAGRLQERPETRSLELFLQAYAAPVPSRADYFSENSRRLHVNEFVRRIVNDNLELYLSSSALERDVAPPRPQRTSFRLSITPTMLSTPRSSWSGFASFKSLSKTFTLSRSSKGAHDSRIHWSQISSTKSILSFLSGNSLLRESLAEDAAEGISEDARERQHMSGQPGPIF